MAGEIPNREEELESVPEYASEDERVWFEAKDPREMILVLSDQLSNRKARLFLASALNSFSDILPARTIELIEKYADGLLESKELDRIRSAINRWANRSLGDRKIYIANTADRLFYKNFGGYGSLQNNEAVSNNIENITRYLSNENYVEVQDEAPPTQEAQKERAKNTGLLRDVAGNPFREVAFDPHWRTSDVVDIARGIYEDKDFGGMAVLSDALMDAGCDNEEIIGHCRNGCEHVRGCWVLDLILQKE